MPFQTKDAFVLEQELSFLTGTSRGNRDIFGIHLRYLRFLLLNLRVRLVQTCGAGIGPKNIRSTFSLPITRTSSCTVQYTAMRTKRMIWIAQKCGQMISESNF